MSTLPDDWQDLRAAAYQRGFALDRQELPRAGYALWEVEPDPRGGEKHGYWRKVYGRRLWFDDLAAVRSWLKGDTMQQDEYLAFLGAKRALAQPSGFTVAADALPERPFAFQRDAISWAARQGRAALFFDTGLGKTTMEVVWADQVARHTGGRVLILAPLAVAHQTVAEGATMGIVVAYVGSQAEADDGEAAICITNYDRVERFDGGAWSGVVLDESSILKSYTGKTKQALLAKFRNTPYRLAATATPAPNDYIELGNHAEFLGVMPSNEMLMRWFINDTMKAGGYRLKGHAEGDYWSWVASWAACVSKPSDLGYSDEGYNLPPLEVVQHTVSVDHTRAWESGQMFLTGAISATKLWREKAATAADRCAKALELVAAEPDEAWILWVDTNEEADLLMAGLPADLAVEVRGSDKPEAKEHKLRAFTTGAARYIVTKAEIAGFGLNWQHCARMAFVGLTYSFEKFYQALRRCYRFGQLRQVIAHLIVAETEGNILATVAHKQEQHRAMQARMTAAMREVGLLAQRAQGLRPYDAPHTMQLPRWLRTKEAA